jgi:hypothetical protein
MRLDAVVVGGGNSADRIAEGQQATAAADSG